jgi:hypothetical protein
MYSIPTTSSPLSGFIRRVLCPALKKNRKIVIGTYFARLKAVTRLTHEKDFQKAVSLGKVWRETKINISPPARKMAMELRNHPLMSYRQLSSWPPTWVWISGNEQDRQLRGEVGILKQVRMVDGHPIVHRCFLWIEYEDSMYLGCLLLSDLSFCESVSKLLEENIGRSIEYIGGLDLSHLD